MSNYAIGDIQGCYGEFIDLLQKIEFDPEEDKLWLVGDLVNRGPNSLETLDYIFNIKESCNVVLGNHDLHLISVSKRLRSTQESDTLDDLLKNKNLTKYINWLKSLPFVHQEIINTVRGKINFFMSHAGLPPHWSLKKASLISEELSSNLKENTEFYLSNIYGNLPSGDNEAISEEDKLKVNTNYLTRMRFCNDKAELNLQEKGGLDTKIKGFKPWFCYKRKFEEKNTRIIFGHWASLRGETGNQKFIATDTGCVWGYELTAIELETGKRFAVRKKENE